MPRHTSLLTSALILAVSLAPPARADDADAAVQFRKAELAETSLGDLKTAADLYRDAARKATSPEKRARAELREGSCLLRLGKTDDAKALLLPLASSGDEVPDEIRRAAKDELEKASIAAPPPVPAPDPSQGPSAGIDRKRLAETERELDEMRAQFDAALKRAQGLEVQTEGLAQKLRQKDDEIRKMREQIAPSSADEVLRLRIQEQDRRRQADRDLSRSYSTFARRLHQEGRFGEARDLLYVALEKDSGNAEAKALLSLVSAPLGDRERLYEEIRGVLALCNEVRGARTAAEIETLVAEGSRRQERGEFAPSVVPLERALSLLDAGSAYMHDPAGSRASILVLLTAAQSHGAPRSPVPPAAKQDDAETRALAAVRGLLTSAGSEVARGLDLRFHDVDSALGAGAAGLAPAPLAAPPIGWTISTEGAEAMPLLLAYLRAADPSALGAPGASLDAVGSTVTAVLDSVAQARLSDRITRLADVTAPAAEVRVAAYRLAPGEFASFLERRGIHPSTTAEGARFAVASAADFDAIGPDLARRADPWPSVAALRATPLRPFRLVAGTAAASVAIDLLPVTKPGAGAGVRVVSEWAPDGRRDGARLRQETTAGAVLEPGAGLAVFGIADPSDPSRDLAVIVRMGVARVATPPELPPPTGLSSSEMAVPSLVRGLTEIVPEPAITAGPPLASREQALAARLRREAKTDAVVVKDDRVRIVGDADARAAARRFLDQVDVVRGLQAFDVSVQQVDAAREKDILRAAPRFSQGAGGKFSWVVLRPEEWKNMERLLERSAGRVWLLEPRIAAPATGRADIVRVVRSAFRREIDLAPARDLTWGRSETALADEGLLLSFRPFGRTTTGRVDFDVSMRAAWIADRGEHRRETQLGPVVSLDPVLDSWSGELSLTLSDEEVLVLAGMRSPLASGGDRDRLVVVVSNARVQ